MTTMHTTRGREMKRWSLYCRLISICIALAGVSQIGIGGCDPTDEIGYTIRIVASDRTAKESDLSTGEFKISINKWLMSDLTVYYVFDGTATEALDYASLTGIAVIPAGELSTTITVTPIDDAIDEGDYEEVYVRIVPPAGYASSKSDRDAIVRILDDDDAVLPKVNIVASAPNAEEGGASGQFTISLTAFSDTALTIAYDVTGTAAKLGVDYVDTVLATNSIIIPANTASVTIDVDAVDDGDMEDQETVIVTLAADPLTSDTYELGSNTSATVFVIDNDAPVATIAATAPVATEAGTNGQFTITLTETVLVDTTINYTVDSASTATVDDDYFTLLEAIVPAGQKTALITVFPKDDALLEGPETVIVNLTAATGTEYTVGTQGSATVIISSDEAPTVSVVATDDSAAETGATGEFKIELDQIVATDVVITYSVGGGADKTGADFTPLSGTVTITAGTQIALVEVIPVLDYDDSEGDESVVITLNNGPGYLVDGANSSDTVTIADYTVPVVSVAKGTDALEGTPIPGGTFVVTVTSTTGEALSIAYSVSGDATVGVDYTQLTGSVSIPSEFSGTADIVVTPLNDSDEENDETVILTLTSPTSGAYKLSTTPSERTATLNIIDDDTP